MDSLLGEESKQLYKRACDNRKAGDSPFVFRLSPRSTSTFHSPGQGVSNVETKKVNCQTYVLMEHIPSIRRAADDFLSFVRLFTSHAFSFTSLCFGALMCS